MSTFMAYSSFVLQRTFDSKLTDISKNLKYERINCMLTAFYQLNLQKITKSGTQEYGPNHFLSFQIASSCFPSFSAEMK